MTGLASLAGLAPFGDPAPQPDPYPPGQLELHQLHQPLHVLGKVSPKLQWTAMKCTGHGSWIFEEDMQSGRAGRPWVSLAAL